MTELRIAEAARFLGVSDDTVRRWIDQGALHSTRSATGQTVVDGLELARLLKERAERINRQQAQHTTSPARRATGSWDWSPRSSRTP